MFVTMNGDLVELNEKKKIISRTQIDNRTTVQYKQEKLIINDIIVEQFSKIFINRLDHAIKNYEIRLQQSIQLFICNRQDVLKINQTDRKLVTRYIWISDNYGELRYSDAPLSKNYKKISLNEISFQYQDIEEKLMKSIKKYNLNPEYLLTIKYKKKQLQVVFLSFRKLSSFIMLCNWILRQRELPQIKFSALIFLKYKLAYAAEQQGLSLKKYLLLQFNRIRTQLTLKGIKVTYLALQNSNQQPIGSSHKKQWSVQLTIKKSKLEGSEKENVQKKIQFT